MRLGLYLGAPLQGPSPTTDPSEYRPYLHPMFRHAVGNADREPILRCGMQHARETSAKSSASTEPKKDETKSWMHPSHAAAGGVHTPTLMSMHYAYMSLR